MFHERLAKCGTRCPSQAASDVYKQQVATDRAGYHQEVQVWKNQNPGRDTWITLENGEITPRPVSSRQRKEIPLNRQTPQDRFDSLYPPPGSNKSKKPQPRKHKPKGGKGAAKDKAQEDDDDPNAPPSAHRSSASKVS
jgi:hypothetical protein